MSEEEKLRITWERSLMVYAIEKKLEDYENTPAKDMLLFLVTDVLTREQLAPLVGIYFAKEEHEVIEGED